MATTLEELDRSIECEQMRVTAEIFADAWDEVTAEGIEPGMVAEVAAHALFARVFMQAGESRAESLIAEITDAIRHGHYLPETSIQ